MGVSSGVIHVNQDDYRLNNFEDAAVMYVGKVTDGGVWSVQQYTQATGVMLWASPRNNTGVADYATAWANRATLTYGAYPVN